MTTTTLPVIRAYLVTVIQALTPASQAADTFRRRDGRIPLRQQPATSALFRRFELRPEGRRDGGGADLAAGVYAQRRLRLEVAYPVALVGLYGSDDLDDLDEMMAADARQIRDALASPANVANAGHAASFVIIGGPDRRAGAAAWFMRLAVDVRFFAAATS